MDELFHNRPTLVENVRKVLLERIEAGSYQNLGGRLPSENALSQEYGVSRATIRDVLTSLELEGIVIRRRGIGTFIDNSMVRSALRVPPYENTGFLRLIRRSGHEASYRVLISEIKPAGALCTRLEVNPDTPCLSMEKLFISDDIPVILCRNVVPLTLVLPQFRKEISGGYHCVESVYTFLRVKCNHVVAYHDSIIKAYLCDERVASLLKSEPGKPILQLEELGYSKSQQPLFYGLSFFLSDLIGFRFRRGLGLNMTSNHHNNGE